MTLHLSDSHESTLHVTLGHGDSALDVYRALRRNTGRHAFPTHISIVDSPVMGAVNVPPAKPTAPAAAHYIGASPVDERPSSPADRDTPTTLTLDVAEREPGGLTDDLGSLSPAALTFSSSEDEAEDELVESLELGADDFAPPPPPPPPPPLHEESFLGVADHAEAEANLASSPPAKTEEHLPPPIRTAAPLARELTLADLPSELLVAVLGWLEGTAIARACSPVCKTWRQVVGQSDELWRTVCARQFPRPARGHHSALGSQSPLAWFQLFKDERLWMRQAAAGETKASRPATSDQRSRYSIEVINATERPMALNTPPPLQPAPLPQRYSGVIAAVASSTARPWEGSVGRGFCVVESSGADGALADSHRAALLSISATNESSPQVIHRQSLEFDLSKRLVSAAQEVTRCVSRFSSVPTCARRRDFAFDRLLLLPPLAKTAAACGDESSGCSAAAEAALTQLNSALAPAARQFGGTERRGGCLLCCGTASSSKEHLLDIGMRRSPYSTPGLAAAFFSELFYSLNTTEPVEHWKQPTSEHRETHRETQTDRDTDTERQPQSHRETVAVKVGILCSSSGSLTDLAALCGIVGRVPCPHNAYYACGHM